MSHPLVKITFKLIDKATAQLNKARRQLDWAVVRITGIDKPEFGMFSKIPNYIKAKRRK